MKIFKLLSPALLLCLAFFTQSCDDRLDLTADYKNITVSYSLLNMNDPVHYFKIYKGYLTDENAFVQAGNWDNIYYPVDSIEVVLEEYDDRGHMLRSAILDTTTAVNKDEGYFASPRQLLYYSTWQLNQEYTYTLRIKRLSTGNEVYAQTNVVGNCKLNKPISQNPFNSKNNNGPKFVLTGEGSASAQDRNVAIADFYLTFNYIEVNNNTHEVCHKSITKKMNSSYKRPASDGDISYDGFTPQNFFMFLKQNIQPNSQVTRYVDTIEGQPYFCLKVDSWFANQDYYTYQMVSTPNSSIVENRLEYTNFVSEDKSAYGLLASRNHTYRLFKFDNTNGSNNEDSLVKGSITKNLGFDYYRNSPEFAGDEVR